MNQKIDSLFIKDDIFRISIYIRLIYTFIYK